jgi:membrane protease YdiL (CAAX protease family)
MAMLWSLWHVPAWFNPALPHHTMPLISTLLFIALFGVFLAFVFNRAGESVLATILAHLSLNVMTGISGVRLSSIVFWRTLAGIFGAFDLLATIGLARRSVSRARRRSIIETEDLGV